MNFHIPQCLVIAAEMIPFFKLYQNTLFPTQIQYLKKTFTDF
jgi:hypothetical protein